MHKRNYPYQTQILGTVRFACQDLSSPISNCKATSGICLGIKAGKHKKILPPVHTPQGQ